MRIATALFLFIAAGCASPELDVSHEIQRQMTYRADTVAEWTGGCPQFGDCEDFALCAVEKLQARGIHATIGVYAAIYVGS
jgi:hypothetical protein